MAEKDKQPEAVPPEPAATPALPPPPHADEEGKATAPEAEKNAAKPAEVPDKRGMDEELARLTGTAILVKIRKGEIDAKSLKTAERRLCLAALVGPEAPRHYTQDEMAGILKVSRQTINVDLRGIRTAIGHVVANATIYQIIGGLHHAKVLCQAKAQEAGDYQAIWAIELSYIEKLQKLGIVFTAPDKVALSGNVTTTPAFAGYTPEVIEKLIALHNANRARRGILQNTQSEN